MNLLQKFFVFVFFFLTYSIIIIIISIIASFTNQHIKK